MGTFFVTMVTISLDGIPPHKIPSASGISNFSRIVAGSFAASITTTVWDSREALHQSRLAEGATAFSPILQGALERLHALGFSDLQAFGALMRNLQLQSYLLATDELFWISGWLSLLALGLVWFTRKPKPQGGPSVAAAD